MLQPDMSKFHALPYSERMRLMAHFAKRANEGAYEEFNSLRVMEYINGKWV